MRLTHSTTTNTNEHSEVTEVTAETAASSSRPSPFRTERGKRLESSPLVLEPGECKVIVMEKGRLGFSEGGFTLERDFVSFKTRTKNCHLPN